jgi:hypothetical protein
MRQKSWKTLLTKSLTQKNRKKSNTKNASDKKKQETAYCQSVTASQNMSHIHIEEKTIFKAETCKLKSVDHVHKESYTKKLLFTESTLRFLNKRLTKKHVHVSTESTLRFLALDYDELFLEVFCGVILALCLRNSFSHELRRAI